MRSAGTATSRSTANKERSKRLACSAPKNESEAEVICDTGRKLPSLLGWGRAVPPNEP